MEHTTLPKTSTTTPTTPTSATPTSSTASTPTSTGGSTNAGGMNTGGMNAGDSGADKSLKQDAKNAASQAGHSLSDSAASKRDQLGRKAEEAKQAAAQKAKEASRYVRQKSSKAIDKRKQMAGEQLDTFAEAIEQAGQKIREGSDPRIADLAESATRKLRGSASYLKNTEPSEIANDVRGLARQHPELVFGGLFVLGLAAARFLKSSEDDHLDEMSAGQNYSSGQGANRGPNYATYPAASSTATGSTTANPAARTSAPPTAAAQSASVTGTPRT